MYMMNLQAVFAYWGLLYYINLQYEGMQVSSWLNNILTQAISK